MSTCAQTILFVASRGDIAGGEKYLFSVLRHLDRSRYTPLLVVPGEGALKTELDALGVENLVMPANYRWLKPPQEWYPFLQSVPTRVRALAALIRQRGVVLVHTNSNQILDGALAARLCGVHHVFRRFRKGLRQSQNGRRRFREGLRRLRKESRKPHKARPKESQTTGFRRSAGIPARDSQSDEESGES